MVSARPPRIHSPTVLLASLLVMLVFATARPPIACAAAGDELKVATARLKELGLTIQGRALVTDAELELRRRLADEKKLRKETQLQQKEVDETLAVEREQLATQEELRRQHRQLNARLAVARNPQENNRLVAAMNELGHQVEQLNTLKKALEQELVGKRQELVRVSDAYIANVLAARKAADAAEQTWKELPQRKEVRDAVEQYERLSNKQLELTASKSLTTQLRLLSRLEKTVLVDSIPLRRDGGGTFTLDVVLNETSPQPMVLDSGASLVCLPHEYAVAAKLDLQAESEPIVLMIADGTQVQAKKMTIPSVRIGQFIAENVEAAVLPPEMANAPALLGMSYLSQFQFAVDSDGKRLQMKQLQRLGEGEKNQNSRGSSSKSRSKPAE